MSPVATAPGEVLRRSHGLCPECLRCVPAEVREAEGKIWLVRTCREHGEARTMLSTHPGYFRDLDRFYFAVMDRSFPQRDYILRMTERCNLECPICLAGANQDVLADFTVEDIRRLVKGMRGRKLDLMGCEPTLLPELPEMLRVIRDSGNISALHSNGVALADFDYVRRLKEAGLDEVHLQFDGFDDAAYTIIRGKPLLASKLKAVDNMERLGIPIDLVMTVLKGVNEAEIPKVLEFGAKHPTVKEVFFLGCRMLGRAVGRFEESQLLPDQMIDLLDAASGGRVSRERVRRFQKLYFSLLAAFGVRKCLYIQHYLLLRDGAGGWLTLDDVLDLGRVELVAERFRARLERGSRLARPLFFLGLLPSFLRTRLIPLLLELLTLASLMAFGFNLRRVRRRTIMLGFITACDPLIYDSAVAENCGKGEISRDLGLQESGALANCLREHRWKKRS